MFANVSEEPVNKDSGSAFLDEFGGNDATAISSGTSGLTFDEGHGPVEHDEGGAMATRPVTGFGGSQGQFKEMTFDDQAADAGSELSRSTNHEFRSAILSLIST
jgi:hypothetical protein